MATKTDTITPIATEAHRSQGAAAALHLGAATGASSNSTVAGAAGTTTDSTAWKHNRDELAASPRDRDAASSPLPSSPPGHESNAMAKKHSAASAALLMLPLCLSVLLSALDVTIVTPAIPTIVSSLRSVTGYIWIGSSFILASTATTPLWGTIADIWGRKPIMLMAIAIFLCGSLLCALSPTMDALIAGRVIQGIGAAGMGTMVNVIVCDTFSMRDRGLYLGITSLVWALGSAVGPILGGLLTTKAE